MRPTTKAMFTFLLMVSAPFAIAQRGGATMHIGHPHDPGRESTLKATADERVALSKCMDASKRLDLAIRRMPRIGSPWSRSRLSYTARDLGELSDLRQQFEEELTALSKIHEELRKELTDVQVSQLKRRLNKLDRLEAQMNSGVGELERDLMRAKPGPASPNISWDVNSIKRAADKWRSEHRKIAKEMGITS